MRRCARFVWRDSGNVDDNDGMILGIAFKTNNLLKKGRVYEVWECDGTLQIKDVGPSHIQVHGPHPYHWQMPAERLFEEAGGLLVLTDAEYQQLCEKGSG